MVLTILSQPTHLSMSLMMMIKIAYIISFEIKQWERRIENLLGKITQLPNKIPKWKVVMNSQTKLYPFQPFSNFLLTKGNPIKP